MRILLTNDDGYKAEGLNVLAKVMESAGHEVWIVAPSKQRSAHSQKITMEKEVHIEKLRERVYSCSGSPADCMLYSLKDGLVDKPDLVISGINHGTNLSTDINYSGTVGAAKEGAMWGIKSIALSAKSQNGNGVFKFKEAATFLAKNIDFFASFADYKTIININYPYYCSDKWEVGGVGFIEYGDAMQSVKEADTNKYLLLGSFPVLKESEFKSDFEIIEEGNISVTPLIVLPGVDGDKYKQLQDLETINK